MNDFWDLDETFILYYFFVRCDDKLAVNIGKGDGLFIASIAESHMPDFHLLTVTSFSSP